VPGIWSYQVDQNGSVPRQVNPAITDCYVGCRYDQREGLVRGTFSVVTSGAYIIYFDPCEVRYPVRVLCLATTEDSWVKPTNTSSILEGGASEAAYAWDRDPFRGYPGHWVTPNPTYADFTADSTTLVYPGGATLHLAVQAKTAYSDVSMKARSFERYDRRFFDCMTETGEYGDPSQPEEAREAVAVYNGSGWRMRTDMLQDAPNTVVRARLGYVIQAGLPLLEVHVVNATTGGAPVNFNFEAKCWSGITYHTLRDAATSPFHTVPAALPTWFASMRTRGVVTKKRSALSEELIAKTVATLHTAPAKTPAVAAVTKAIVQNSGTKPSGFRGLLDSVLNAVGVDPADPLPSIGRLAGKALMPLVRSLL